LVKVKAVLFDLYGTLVYLEKLITEEEISEYLFSKGYEVSPQQFRAAWTFVAFIDCPKYGYKNYRSFLSRIFCRLKVKVDKETLDAITKIFENSPYQLYPDATEAVVQAKKHGFKTAIVTTIAHFKFKKAIQPIEKHFDFIMTGYEAGCDKTNPRMYRKVLEILDVKPKEAVMIGDDVPVDIILPKKLGINAILLDRERKNLECQDADGIINSLKDAVETVIRKFGNS